MHGQRTLKFLRLILLVFLLSGLPFTSTVAAPSSTVDKSPGAAHPSSASPLNTNVLDVPLSGATPTVDGKCNEYATAITQTFTDGNGKNATVYLEYSGGFLYICLQAQPGTFDQRFAAVYLDPQGNGSSYTYAQKDDYGFQVGIKDGATSSYNGTGIGGYAPDPSLDSLWQGAAAIDPSGAGESAEYALDAGRWLIQPCSLFGIAVYHQSFAAIGDDYGWPSNHYYDQPKTWQLARMDNGSCSNGKSGKIAYVFHGNTQSATSFYNLLVAHGYSVDLVPLGDVLTTDFSAYDLILIADDTGDLDQWGTTGNTDAQVANIVAGFKPIVGLGEGGYAFFGRIPLFIGWPNGWHGLQDQVKKYSTAPAAFYAGLASDPVNHYTTPVNSVGIYTGTNPLPADFQVIGQEVPTSDHASLSREDCRLLWGASGNPLAMSADGRILFLNAVSYMRFFQCSRPTLPPQSCITIDKTSNPPSGTSVTPGDIIDYTITYTVSNDPACKEPTGIRLVDTVPADTIFVPGSATGGISPGADGSLREALLTARRFVEAYPVDTAGKGLLLTGSIGVGKTHLAVGVLRRLVQERGVRGLFCDYRELLKQIQASYNPESQTTEMEVLEPVLKTDVLLLDDLGASKPSAWALETVGHILNARYNDKRVTLVTTNYLDTQRPGDSNRQMVREDTLADRIGQRIRSRLYEMCRTIEIVAPDFRKRVRQAWPMS